MQVNFNTKKHSLNEDDLNQLTKIIGMKCGTKTRFRIRNMIARYPSAIKEYGIFERIVADTYIGINGHVRSWHYIPGQSYNDEIRTIRNLIIRG